MTLPLFHYKAMDAPQQPRQLFRHSAISVFGSPADALRQQTLATAEAAHAACDSFLEAYTHWLSHRLEFSFTNLRSSSSSLARRK